MKSLMDTTRVPNIQLRQAEGFAGNLAISFKVTLRHIILLSQSTRGEPFQEYTVSLTLNGLSPRTRVTFVEDALLVPLLRKIMEGEATTLTAGIQDRARREQET